MTTFDEGETGVLKRDAYFRFQRAAHSNGERVLVKVAASEYASSEEELLEREFELFTRLDSHRCLAPIRLAKDGQKLAAYFHDVDGVPLSLDARIRAGDLAQILDATREICAVLGAVHRAGTVLVGLAMDSFFVTHGTRQIVLTDAPFAQLTGSPSRSGEQCSLGFPYLSYAAPEVVGGLAVPLDARADLYSLGVLLYQLLSGKLPFETNEPAEIIHCHLARQAVPLGELNPALAPAVGRLVNRLLSKRPSERYESVEAVDREIARVRDSSFRRQSDAAAATAADERPAPVFSVSERLYGRDEALRTLTGTLGAAGGRPRVVFIEGEGGVGKTALVQTLRNAPEAARAVFCSGKFNEAQHDAPLGGWSTVIRDLANETLTLSTAELETRRRHIESELGNLVGVIEVLAPEWTRIFGRPPSPPEQPSDAHLKRHALATHRLLRCFSSGDAPAVLFLDDAQWADPSSLRILQLLLGIPDPVNLVALVAARVTDSGTEWPEVARLRGELEAMPLSVTLLTLGPLGEPHVRSMLVEGVADPLERVDELVDLLLRKTGGSPFFLRQFIALLVQRHLLHWDAHRQVWTWTQSGIESLPLADNVVAFLAQRLLALPLSVKAVLRTAACLGPRFTLSEFAAVRGCDEEAAARDLAMATSEGVLHGAYEFVHDRLLEACRELLSQEDRTHLHLHIGQTLLRTFAETDERHAYLMAAHFNAARPIIREGSVRSAAVDLNLKAGRMALQRGAFGQALAFFTAGLDFLGADVGAPQCPPQRDHDAWTAQFETALVLHLQAAEAALLNGRLDLMNELCDRVLLRARSPVQKAGAYELRISGFKMERDFPAAVRAGLEILADLGIRFPKAPTMVHVIAGLLVTKHRVVKSGVSTLSRLPAATDVRAKAATRIIQAVYPAAYFSNPRLFPFFVYRHVSESLKHGNESYSAVTYSAFAVVLCAMGDVEHAFQLGQVALDLVRSFAANALKAKVFSVYYFLVFPWKNHVRDSIPFFIEGARVGIEHGDFEYACYILTQHSLARLHSGASLSQHQNEYADHLERARSLGQERSVLVQQLLCQVVFDLQNRAPGAKVLAGPFCDEGERPVSRGAAPVDPNLAFLKHLGRMMLASVFKDVGGATEAARLGRTYLADAAFGSYMGGVFLYYESLVLLSQRGRDRATVRRVRANQRQLRKWSRNAPMNFASKFHLVEALRASLRGRDAAATEHFEKAIELAQTHGYTHEVAIAHERAAAHYFARGMRRLGQHHLRECHHAYGRWGATAKLRALQTDHAQDFAVLSATSSDPAGAMTVARLADTLDYRSLLKASQAMSSEMRFPQLSATLLRVLIEHAGAQRGLLLLERGGQLFVEAAADVDEDRIAVFERERVDETKRLCQAVVHYAARMEKAVVLEDASRHDLFGRDPYVRARKPKSVLCAPISYQGRLLGLVYLENNRMTHLFTQARFDVINVLAAQAAISIANARFHALQLEAQQAKISPHFLFNALSSIADLAVSDGRRAEEAITRLAQLYRYILTNGADQLVTLEQELQVVRTYLDLEKLRFADKLEFSIFTEGDVKRVQIPGLLIQPLVENSIRHGISRKVGGGSVTVQAIVSADRCWITVQDDGDGTKPGTSGTGFGLRSVQERLALLYGERYSFAIAQGGGYRVEIEVPTVPDRTGSGSWKVRAARAAQDDDTPAA